MFIKLAGTATKALSQTSFRSFSSTVAKMGVTKTTHTEGSGVVPNKGDKVTIEYTGWLKDTSKPDNKGKQYVPTPSNAAILA